MKRLSSPKYHYWKLVLCPRYIWDLLHNHIKLHANNCNTLQRKFKKSSLSWHLSVVLCMWKYEFLLFINLITSLYTLKCIYYISYAKFQSISTCINIKYYLLIFRFWCRTISIWKCLDAVPIGVNFLGATSWSSYVNSRILSFELSILA